MKHAFFYIVWMPLVWAAARGEEPAQAVSGLTVLTYNVLAEQTEQAASGRLDALLHQIRDSKADVMAFQEAMPWFIERLRKQEWLAGFHPGTDDGSWKPMGGGLFIVSRYPIVEAEFFGLPSRQGRGVLVVDVKIPESGKRDSARVLRIATVHLESFLEDGVVRAEQLKRVLALLRYAPHALLIGDFNFGDTEEPETRTLEPAGVDVWRAIYPNDPGYTWNIEKSPMAKAGSFPNEPSRRLDRILLRSPHWQVKTVRIIGNAPVSADRPELFPSDHFGLSAGFVSSEARE